MDPNEALKRIRELALEIRRDNDEAPIMELLDTFDGLDEWLGEKSGFLPSDWQHGNDKIVGALRQLPWGEDVEINGGDLVELVGQLLAAVDEPDLLDLLAEKAAKDFNPDDDEPVELVKKPGDSCVFGPTMGLITHRRWGDEGDCDEHEHGVITDAATGKVVGRLGQGDFA